MLTPQNVLTTSDTHTHMLWKALDMEDQLDTSPPYAAHGTPQTYRGSTFSFFAEAKEHTSSKAGGD